MIWDPEKNLTESGRIRKDPKLWLWWAIRVCVRSKCASHPNDASDDASNTQTKWRHFYCCWVSSSALVIVKPTAITVAASAMFIRIWHSREGDTTLLFTRTISARVMSPLKNGKDFSPIFQYEIATKSFQSPSQHFHRIFLLRHDHLTTIFR